MSDYAFYARTLRFVARKSDQGDARVAAMMDALAQAADAVEAAGVVTVAPASIELTARAFAGVAGFLQKQILPEVVADGNKGGEAQVRWSIDTSMELVNRLLGSVARGAADGPVTIDLPPPPQQA